MRSLRRRILVPLLLVLFGLALGELGARVLVALDRRFAWRPLPPFGHSPIQRDWLARSERELASGAAPTSYSQFDPVLGWTTRPGFASADGRVHVNAQGLRGAREYAATPPAGMRRILVCGESFTFCEEVADAEAWPAQLEARRRDLEVLNYGVGGYGTDQALLRVSREARGPIDLLVVGLMLENIGRNVNRYRPLWYPAAEPAAKPRYVLAERELELVPQPFATRAEIVAAVRSDEILARLAEHEFWNDATPPGWLAWSTLARLAAARGAYAAREPERLWTDLDGEPFRVTLALLESFCDVARTLGTEHLLVLIFPTRSDLVGFLDHRPRYWTTLLTALDARGLPALDLTPALAAAAPAAGGPDALFLLSHLAPRANSIVAEALETWLTQAAAPPTPK